MLLFVPRYFSLMSTSAFIVVVLCPLISLFQFPHVQCYPYVTSLLLFLSTLFLFDVNLRLHCRRSLSFDVTLPPPSRPMLDLPQCYPLESYLLPSSEPRQT